MSRQIVRENFHRFQSLPPEQRRVLQQRWQSASPAERRQMMDRARAHRPEHRPN